MKHKTGLFSSPEIMDPINGENRDLTEDEIFMSMALAQAREAFRIGEVPVGAVIVHKGYPVASGYNQREMRQDPSAHAEMTAIRKASKALATWRLTDTTLYVTLEPCAMCAGAIIQARVQRLVFGALDPKAGVCGSICDLTAETRFNHRVIVESGCLAQESRQLLQSFFQQLRQVQPVVSLS